MEEGEESSSDEVEEDEEGRLFGRQDNEFDLIFYSYSRLLEDLRRQCLDFGYRTNSSDEEEEETGEVGSEEEEEE